MLSLAIPLHIAFNHFKSASITDRLIIALLLHRDRFARFAKSATLSKRREAFSMLALVPFPTTLCTCICDVKYIRAAARHEY
jgi:hypothetical protein